MWCRVRCIASALISFNTIVSTVKIMKLIKYIIQILNIKEGERKIYGKRHIKIMRIYNIASRVVAAATNHSGEHHTIISAIFPVCQFSYRWLFNSLFFY